METEISNGKFDKAVSGELVIDGSIIVDLRPWIYPTAW